MFQLLHRMGLQPLKGKLPRLLDTARACLENRCCLLTHKILLWYSDTGTTEVWPACVQTPGFCSGNKPCPAPDGKRGNLAAHRNLAVYPGQSCPIRSAQVRKTCRQTPPYEPEHCSSCVVAPFFPILWKMISGRRANSKQRYCCGHFGSIVLVVMGLVLRYNGEDYHNESATGLCRDSQRTKYGESCGKIGDAKYVTRTDQPQKEGRHEEQYHEH